jgi:hypothetical protein
VTSYTRDGKPSYPKPPSLLDYLEEDAVALLRTQGQFGRAMRDRLNARYYLMSVKGWSKERVDAAQRGEVELP